MAKHVPEILRDVILPFDWDVRRVWALDAESIQLSRLSFDHFLYLPLWSSEPGRGMLFDVRPIDVVRNPRGYPYQSSRLEACDPERPIDLLVYEGRRWILDGTHRLVRRYIDGIEEVLARIHDQSVVSDIRVGV